MGLAATCFRPAMRLEIRFPNESTLRRVAAGGSLAIRSQVRITDEASLGDISSRGGKGNKEQRQYFVGHVC
jgi:hypothetical protein